MTRRCDPARLGHAASNNPGGEPPSPRLRAGRGGLCAGGIGILLTSRLVDELAFNERHDELMFVEYLS